VRKQFIELCEKVRAKKGSIFTLDMISTSRVLWKGIKKTANEMPPREILS